MYKNQSKRLLNGVRELTRLDGVSLEELHAVATDLVVFIDRKTEAMVKKLKNGQSIKIYDESSNKEYGAKNSSLFCYFDSVCENQKKEKTLRVYNDKKKWSVSIYCLLDVLDTFDPLSEEGMKIISKSIPKKRGRKPRNKQKEDFICSTDFGDSDFHQSPETYNSVNGEDDFKAYEWDESYYFDDDE